MTEESIPAGTNGTTTVVAINCLRKTQRGALISAWWRFVRIGFAAGIGAVCLAVAAEPGIVSQILSEMHIGPGWQKVIMVFIVASLAAWDKLRRDTEGIKKAEKEGAK